MTIETHLDSARERARSERDAVQKKESAYKQFISRVQDLSPESIQRGQHTAAFTGGGTQISEAPIQTETNCSTVRTAFQDTVCPHSVDDRDDEPLLETIRAELSDSIAMAVAPTTETRLTRDLQEAIVAEAQTRRVELQTMNTALAREIDQLEIALSTVTPILEWLVDANETALTKLGFDALQARHSTLETHRESCETLLRDRQAFLHQTTSRAAKAGITHQTLVEYLYRDFPVDHPVLSTGVRLDGLCAEGQQTVRSHLVRRV